MRRRAPDGGKVPGQLFDPAGLLVGQQASEGFGLPLAFRFGFFDRFPGQAPAFLPAVFRLIGLADMEPAGLVFPSIACRQGFDRHPPAAEPADGPRLQQGAAVAQRVPAGLVRRQTRVVVRQLPVVAQAILPAVEPGMHVRQADLPLVRRTRARCSAAAAADVLAPSVAPE